MESYHDIRKAIDGKCAVDKLQLLVMYELLLEASKLEGCGVELGVFRGGTARMISSVLQPKRVHLYDTFEGTPDVQTKHDLKIYHKKGSFFGSIEEVQELLSGCNVTYHKGIFPDDVLNELPEESICFAHVDADLYTPTLSFLNLMYPKVVSGGIIVVHDYRSGPCPGVTEACNKFMINKHERICMEVPGQCYIRKV